MLSVGLDLDFEFLDTIICLGLGPVGGLGPSAGSLLTVTLVMVENG